MLAIRSHVDITDPALVGVEALLHVKETVKESLDIQLVAFPQDVSTFVSRVQVLPGAAKWKVERAWWSSHQAKLRDKA